jgi:hypothetical protein
MKNTSMKPLMPMMYFFPREEHQIFIKKFMEPTHQKSQAEVYPRVTTTSTSMNRISNEYLKRC